MSESKAQRIHGIETRRKLLNYINGYIRAHGYAPSMREMLEALDLKSTSVVDYHLNRLAELKYIRRDKGRSRAIVVLALEIKEYEDDVDTKD